MKSIDYILNKYFFAFLMALCLFQPVHAANPFVRVQLMHGVSFLMPRNWVVLSNNTRINIEAYISSKSKRATDGDLVFSANLYSDDHSLVALTNVRFYPEQTVTQADIESMTHDDINEMAGYLREEFSIGSRVFSLSILQWHETKRIKINGAFVLAYGYRRSAIPQSPNRSSFNVRFYRVLNGPHSFTLTVSYREDQALLIAPICDAIVSSLSVDELKG